MEVRSLDVKGRDVVAAIACIAAMAGAATDTVQPEVAVGVVMTVLAGYGFATGRYRQRERKGK